METKSIKTRDTPESDADIDIELGTELTTIKSSEKEVVPHRDRKLPPVEAILHPIGVADEEEITAQFKLKHFPPSYVANYLTMIPAILNNNDGDLSDLGSVEQIRKLPHIIVIGLQNNDSNIIYRNNLPIVISSEILNAIKMFKDDFRKRARLAFLILTTNVLISAYWVMRPIWKIVGNIELNQTMPLYRIFVYSSREKNKETISEMLEWLLPNRE